MWNTVAGVYFETQIFCVDKQIFSKGSSVVVKDGTITMSKRALDSEHQLVEMDVS